MRSGSSDPPGCAFGRGGVASRCPAQEQGVPSEHCTGMENLVEAPALPAAGTARRWQLPAVFSTVRGRMVFWILVVTVPSYAAAALMSYEATARRLETAAERDADELAARLAGGIDAVIRSIEGGIRTVAAQLEEVDPPREQYLARLR